MRPRHKVLVDGRIFSLQKKGGISKLWAKVLASAVWQSKIETFVVLYPGWDRNIHLVECGALDDVAAIHAVKLSLPPSDNPNYASNAIASQRRQEILSQCTSRVSSVINTYYGENVLADGNYVVTALDFAHEELPELAAKQSTPHVLRQKLLAFEQACRISFISNASRERFFVHYPQFNDKSTSVIHLGHDNTIGSVIRVTGMLLHVGTRSGYKDFRTVADGIRTVMETYPHTRFVILGGEPMDQDTARLMTLFPARVGFDPQPTDRQMDVAMASADIFISASHYEGFGIPLLDALRFGTKAVVSDIAPYREIAGELASYFPPGCSAALAARVEDALRKPSIEAAVIRTWEDVAHDYVELLGA